MPNETSFPVPDPPTRPQGAPEPPREPSQAATPPTPPPPAPADPGGPQTPPLGFFPFTLPSRGQFYLDPDSKRPILDGGSVNLRKFKAREQALLQQAGGGLAGKLNTIVSTCTKLPKGLDPLDLLMVDRFAILLALRTKTYGAQYSVQYTCSECSARCTADINIAEDFNEEVPEPDLQEPFPVELPVSGSTLHCRFLRGRDEEQVLKHARRLQMQGNDDGDPSYLYRLALQVEQIDGVQKDVISRQRFIEDLDPNDLIALEDRINELEPGIDTRVYPECSKCGFVNSFAMPLQGEFFRPRRRR